MARRTGVTLSEVLIAIFVMAIGLMAVLTLFPLGALSMAQAIKDDRCAESNKNASALARRAWQEMLAPDSQAPNGEMANLNAPNYYEPAPATAIADPFVNAMVDPNYPGTAPPAVVPHPYPSTASPVLAPLNAANQFYQSGRWSYPVFVDMVGWNNNAIAGTPYQYWVGGQVGNAATNQPASIPRRTLRAGQYMRVSRNPPVYIDWSLVGSPPLPIGVTGSQIRSGFMHRYFYLTDDLSWGADGTLVDTNGTTAAASGTPLSGSVQRDGRYSWAFLLRRPQVNLPEQADLTIVVFSSRTVDTPADENNQWIEQPYPNTRFYLNTNEAEIYYGALNNNLPRPKIRKNSWILDATMAHRKSTGEYVPAPHGYFYRVVEVNDDTTNVLRLTLQQRVRWDHPNDGWSVQNGAGIGLAIVMEHVAEVFERNTLRDTTMPVP